MAITQMLNRLTIPRDRPAGVDLPLITVALIGGALAFLAIRLGESGFSPDSWGYFELAKTIFSEHFYRFNTYRNYFSEAQSASFPFGYPLVIALGHRIFGVYPMVAVGFNIAAALGTALLIISICRKYHVPALAQIALALSLLLYNGYLDEVLFGRSIPLSLLLFVAAFRVVLTERYFAAGVLLGLSALVRFDFLVFGLLFLAALPLLDTRQAAHRVAALGGFLAAVTPWIVYSFVYFGKWWVSDNAWVALSATPAYVADFPAMAETHVFNAPAQWLARVLANGPELFKYLVWWSFRYPLVIAMAAFAFVCWVKRRYAVERTTLLVGALLLMSLVPYVLTRYFDDRYFALLFLILSFFLMIRVGKERILGLGIAQIAILSIVATVAVEANALLADFRSADLAAEKSSLDEKFIASLNACQKLNPNIKYIFTGDAYRLAPRYGATTGGLTAFIPSNFDRMSEQGKQAYFEKMKPYVLIDKVSENYKCPS